MIKFNKHPKNQDTHNKNKSQNLESGVKALTKPLKPTKRSSIISYYTKRIVGALGIVVLNSGFINGYYNEAYNIANAINNNNLTNAGLYFYLFMMIPIGIFLAMFAFGSIVWIVNFKWQSKHLQTYFQTQLTKYHQKMEKYNQRQTNESKK